MNREHLQMALDVLLYFGDQLRKERRLLTDAGQYHSAAAVWSRVRHVDACIEMIRDAFETTRDVPARDDRVGS